MLHHYNYASPLSHFLSYHQLQEQNECSNGQTTPNSVCDDLGQQIVGESRGFKSVNGTANGKSFTIAAILGLKPDAVGNNDIQTGPTDLTVVNLSVHQGLSDRNLGSHVSDCSSRLQLPVRGGHASSGAGGGGPGGGMSSVPYPTVAGGTCQQQRPSVRGLKHMNSTGSSSNKKSSSSKSKRVRTIFTPEQLERLEAEFERQQYMVGPERLYLAHTLQLTEAQVKVWFQNRRIKWRKHHLEITHQRLAAIKQQQIQHHLLGDTNTDTLDSNNSSGTDT